MMKAFSSLFLLVAMSAGTADSSEAQESRRAVMRQKLEQFTPAQRAELRMKRAESQKAQEVQKTRVRTKTDKKKLETETPGDSEKPKASRGQHEGHARKKAKRRQEHLEKKKQVKGADGAK